MDKGALFAAWAEHLRGVRAGLVSAQGDATAGARVDGDHRPQNRGERGAVTAQGYLAAGLGARLAALDAALDLLDRIEPSARDRAVTGAVVSLESEAGEALALAILPGGDGSAVEGVVVVSPEAPVAVAVWGRSAGEELTLVRGGQAASWEVVDVA